MKNIREIDGLVDLFVYKIAQVASSWPAHKVHPSLIIMWLTKSGFSNIQNAKSVFPGHMNFIAEYEGINSEIGIKPDQISLRTYAPDVRDVQRGKFTEKHLSSIFSLFAKKINQERSKPKITETGPAANPYKLGPAPNPYKKPNSS